MPAAYAHYRFGREMLKLIPPEQRSAVEKARSFYDLGLQGPDLLFYYDPLRKNPVGSLGSHIHACSALSFFRPAGKRLRVDPSPELAAYIYGYVCHFALDLHCHGYIRRIVDQGGPSHQQQETALDLLFLEEDRLKPRLRLNMLAPSLELARVIAPLYPRLSPAKLYRAMVCMKGLDIFLGLSAPVPLALLRRILHLAGAHGIEDMLLCIPQSPDALAAGRELRELCSQAQDTALGLISDFKDSAWGRMNYDLLYKYNFDSCLAGPEKEK